jgi:hypothetical protein
VNTRIVTLSFKPHPAAKRVYISIDGDAAADMIYAHFGWKR